MSTVKAIALVQFDDGGDEPVESAASQADLLTHPIGALRPADRAIDFPRYEALYKAVVDKAQLIAAAHDAAHADGRHQRLPALRGGNDFDEQVAWKERPQHLSDATRMRHPPANERAVGLKILPLQVLERDALAVRMGVDHRPPGGLVILTVLGTHPVPPR